MNILNQYIDLETNLGGVGQSNSWGGQTGPWGGRLPPSTGPNGASVRKSLLWTNFGHIANRLKLSPHCSYRNVSLRTSLN